MRWSESDNYFVSGSLKVFSVDLNSSEPLKLVPEENVTYDGPKGDDFKALLLDNGFRVNRQGKAVVGVPKRNNKKDYNFFLLEKVVPLGPYVFTNEPSPTQEMKVLKSLLDETRVDLAKKNAEVDELHRKILDWNSEQLRLTMDAITESIKKVFVDVDLKSPAKSGDPPSVLGFLQMLLSLFLEKANGEAIFERSLTPLPESSSITDVVNTGSSKVGVDFMGFLCRMNRTFVNKEGKYLKFNFTAIKYIGSPHIHDDKIYYYNESCKVFDPIIKVQYDMNEEPQVQVLNVQDMNEKPESSPKKKTFFTRKKKKPQSVIRRKLSICEEFTSGGADADAVKTLTGENSLGRSCAFVCKDLCFLGKITAVAGQGFRHNARVCEFFEQSELGQQDCYIDALATTFFVFNSNNTEYWMNRVAAFPYINQYRVKTV